MQTCRLNTINVVHSKAIFSPEQSPVSALTALWSPLCCPLFQASPGSLLAMTKTPAGSLQGLGSLGIYKVSLLLFSARLGAPAEVGLLLWPLLLTPCLLQTETGPLGRYPQLSALWGKKGKTIHISIYIYLSIYILIDFSTFEFRILCFSFYHTYIYIIYQNKETFYQAVPYEGFRASPAVQLHLKLLADSQLQDSVLSWDWAPSGVASLSCPPHNHWNLEREGRFHSLL